MVVVEGEGLPLKDLLLEELVLLPPPVLEGTDPAASHVLICGKEGSGNPVIHTGSTPV